MEKFQLFFDFFNLLFGSALLYHATIGLKKNKAGQEKLNKVVKEYRVAILLIGSLLVVVSIFKIVNSFL